MIFRKKNVCVNIWACRMRYIYTIWVFLSYWGTRRLGQNRGSASTFCNRGLTRRLAYGVRPLEFGPDVRLLGSAYGVLKLKIQNSKSKTRNRKLEIENWKLKTQNRKLEMEK